MSKSFFYFIRSFAYFGLLVGFVLALFVSCSSAPKVKSSSKNTKTQVESIDQENESLIDFSQDKGTVLAVPKVEVSKKNEYELLVLSYLEKGSPASIKKAVDLIQVDPQGMSESNRSYLRLAGEIMKIVYPLVTISWTMPSVPQSDIYIGAIEASRKGVYDYSTKPVDFLSSVLPSFVIAMFSGVNEYYADAERALLSAKKRNADSVLPPLLLALLYEKQGALDASIDYYKQAWDIDQSCYPAGIGYTNLLINAGRGREAFDVTEVLFKQFPEEKSLLKLSAQTAFEAQAWKEADFYIMSVLRNEPENIMFLLMRARILVEQKEYLKASSLLDAFATQNRSDKDYLLLRSRVLREWNKNYSTAFNLIQEAYTLYPQDKAVMLASAEISYQTGQSINGLTAKELVLHVLAEDPLNENALTLLVQEHLAHKEWNLALENALTLEKHHKNNESKILLARSYLGANQAQKANEIMSALYVQDSGNEQILSLYLESLLALNKIPEVKSLVQSRIGQANASVKSILYYFESYTFTDGESQMASLRSSLLSNPRNTKSLLAMYQWYYERKDYKKAQYYLKQVVALDQTNRDYLLLLEKIEDLLAR